MNTWQAIASGLTGAALVALLDHMILWKLQRMATEEDRKIKQREEMCAHDRERIEQLSILVETCRKFLIISSMDRIQYLCQSYICDNEVTPGALRRIHIMHQCYQELGGEDDALCALIKRVDKLPLAKEEADDFSV